MGGTSPPAARSPEEAPGETVTQADAPIEVDVVVRPSLDSVGPRIR